MADAIRLRNGTHARSIGDHGVAISAGGSVVVLDGPSAVSVWTALSPLLEAGVDRDDLLDAVPAPGREAVRSVLARLDDQALLRDLEPEADAVNVPAGPHFERITRRPAAAARALVETTVSVSGTSAALVAAIAAQLREAGAAHVEITAPTDGLEARVTIARPGTSSRDAAVAVRAGDRRVVGPRAADADPELVADLVAWATDVPPAPNVPSDLVDVLTAGQVVLTVLGAIARGVDEYSDGTADAERSRWPQYIVTTDDLVAEVRTRVTLPRLVHVPLHTVSAARLGEEADPMTALTVLAPLWDPALGLVEQPLPRDLEQSPLGLADAASVTGGRRVGVGATTALARIDAVCAELTLLLTDPPRGGRAAAIGIDDRSAAIAAIVRLLDNTPLSWLPVPVPAHAYSTSAHRRYAALTLRFGRTIAVAATADAARDLVRVDVHDDVVGLVGRAYGPSVTAALEGALGRASGWAQWAQGGKPDGGWDPLDSRSPAAVNALAAWWEPAGITVSTTESAAYTAAGIVGAVATW